MEILVDLVGHTRRDGSVALDKITFGVKLGGHPKPCLLSMPRQSML
jgi:hypothetical protein